MSHSRPQPCVFQVKKVDEVIILYLRAKLNKFKGQKIRFFRDSSNIKMWYFLITTIADLSLLIIVNNS